MHIIKGISRYCLLLLLLMFLTPVRASGIKTVGVEKGVMDLRDIEKGTGFIMRMNGEWEFYFERFLNPQDKSETRIPDCYSRVPSYWTQNTGCGKNFNGTGYGTYRCIVLLPSGYRDALGFDVPTFDTSYEMFVNGALVSKSGKPGKNKSESTPNYNPVFVKYVPSSDTLEIIIKVSNYELRRGGFSLP